jgi:hypothetical protein
MTKHLLMLALTVVVFQTTGCFFSKKAKLAKENPAISADVEESFRRRWVDKRVAELAAAGTAAETAKSQAETEFRDRFGFTRAAQGKK